MSVTSEVVQSTVKPYPLLAAWLALGLAWLLLGMLLLPSSKLYHQGLILFLWLPGLASFLPGIRARLFWDRQLLAAALGCAAWAMLSVLWGGDAGHIKEMLYVGLAMQAFVLLGGLYRERLWSLLACIALLGSLALGWFIFSFYALQARPLQARLIGAGLLDHPILAAHVAGALGILLCLLRRSLPRRLQGWVWLLGCLLCLAFVVLSRSKGPMLAVLAALVFTGFLASSLRGLCLSALVVAAAVLAVWAFPAFLLRGGLSYRPDLLRDAWDLFQLHPWLGLGLGADYQLTVEQTGRVYEHAHNLFVHILLQLGVPGLLLWLLMPLLVFRGAWRQRGTQHGRALCGLLCFSVVALLTDGVGPWVKPREEWFTVWLPILLGFAWYASAPGQGAVDRRVT
jgi:O-antigen ligase